MNLRLLCHKRYSLGDRLGLSHTLCVRDKSGPVATHYKVMCAAIDNDISSSDAADAIMEWIRKIEVGELHIIDVDGNGWVTYITREKVWFEGLFNQGEGSEISLSQFKFVVQTYRRFLNDPEHKTIEVDFPSP